MNVNTASVKQRFCSFVIDTVFFVTVFFGAASIIWFLVPDSSVPVEAMALFNKKERIAYEWTVVFGFIFSTIYFTILPVSSLGCTLGQKLFSIRKVRRSGEKFRWYDFFRHFFVQLVKLILIFIIGPIMAFNTNSIYLPWFLLFFPLGVIVVITIVAWLKKDGCYLWEKIGNYRYVSIKSQNAI